MFLWYTILVIVYMGSHGARIYSILYISQVPLEMREKLYTGKTQSQREVFVYMYSL